MSKILRPSRMSLILASGIAPAYIHTPVYANTITAILPSLYTAMDVVSRELVGYIPSVMRNTDVERAAVGQAVTWPVPPAATAFDITPAMAIPEPADKTWTSNSMSITKSRGVEFGWTGEEQLSLNAGGSGPGYMNAQATAFAEALRTLCNEVEADLAAEAAANASRAYGTAGTTPFGTNLGEAAQIKKILDDNGAPPSRSMVINTTTGASLRTLQQLTKVNEAGTQMTLRQGELLDLMGLSIKETGQPVSHTKGTGASATTNTAGYAVGATTITLASAGTGTIVAGDTVTFAGDTNKYQVVTGDADVSNGGTIVLAAPGLRVAIAASATAITVGNSYTANVAFSQSAMAVAMRPPAIPKEGDAAVDSHILVDPRSGIPFEVRLYLGYHKVRLEVALAWGVKAVKRNHIAMLLG